MPSAPAARPLYLAAWACPRCTSGAVAVTARREDPTGHVHQTLRCGACGTWRALSLPRPLAERFDAALDADLAAMRRELERRPAPRRAPIAAR
jgi:hypothetical protein